MRIVVCSKKDLAGAVILNRVLALLAGHELMVLLSDKTRGAETAVPDLMELKLLERDLPLGTLFPLIDADPTAVGALLTFRGLERRWGVNFATIDDINSPASLAALRAFAPDLTLSIRFSHIFRPEAYGVARLGTFNIHPGALPHYAGLFAPFRAMMDDQDRLGCTLHRVDAKIDTGPIVGIGWLPVVPERGLLWHILGAYDPGIDLLEQALAHWVAGLSVPEYNQDYSARVYRSMPDAAAFLHFRNRGFRLYDPVHYHAVLARFLPLAGRP